VIFGDFGVVNQDVLAAKDTTRVQTQLQRIQTTAIATLRNIESRSLQKGADDFIYGNAGRDILIGNTGSDAIDAGAQDDLVFGDNVVLAYRANDVTSLRFQTLIGTRIYSNTNFDTNATLGYDNSGQLLVDGTARNYRSPDANVPWWAEYAVTNLYQNTSMDMGLTGAGSFGNDYIAGGAANDLLFGQLGNDTLQGDGSIDYISHRYVDDALATIDPALLGGRVTAYRTPGAPCTVAGGICDPIGPLTVYPSYEAATDGDDYIEGRRRQRHRVRRPRPGRHRRRQLVILQPDDARPAAGRLGHAVRWRRHAHRARPGLLRRRGRRACARRRHHRR
jgi:Ca2+-binding RTX toxin-like protein